MPAATMPSDITDACAITPGMVLHVVSWHVGKKFVLAKLQLVCWYITVQCGKFFILVMEELFLLCKLDSSSNSVGC